jgi:hypothetical protein
MSMMGEIVEEPASGSDRAELFHQLYCSFITLATALGCSEQEAVLFLYELAVGDLERLAPPDDVAASNLSEMRAVLH